MRTLADAVADCALVVGTTSSGPRALEHPLRRLERGGRLIAKQLATAPVALLFGSEKFGLSNDDLSHCHWLMRIPTREEHGSMNLGQAVAVCLYEIVRSPRPRELRPSRVAPPMPKAPRLKIWSASRCCSKKCWRDSGYVHGAGGGSTRLKIRRLIRRMNLNAHDAEVWLGMLRQIRWKLISYKQ